MKFSVGIAILLAGSTVAAPLAGDVFAREETAGHIEKRFPWTVFGLGSLATWLGSKVFKKGQSKRSLAAIEAKPMEEWSFDEARQAFADSAVKRLEELDDTHDAIICTDDDYRVENPANTKEFSGFTLEAGGQKAKYECFGVVSPNRVTINGQDNDASVSVLAGPGRWDSKSGVLTV